MKAAVDEPNPATSSAIIQAAGLTLMDNILMTVYDQGQHRYEIPPYLINEPEHYGQGLNIIQINQPVKEEIIELTMRSPKFKDLVMRVSNCIKVSKLKEDFASHYEVKDEKIRLFSSGKELQDTNTLAHHKIQTGMMLQVAIIG